MAERRPRGPGFVLGVLVFVLVVLVAAVALSARQPPPPTIAEFAPQAVEQITDVQSDLASKRGRGAAAGAVSDESAASPAVSALRIDVPRVRRCVGDPPRQIEDPQSPPCVPYWAGDNGGATSKGVTRDTIRIVSTVTGTERGMAALQNFFNRRFEFYGRRLRIVVTGDGEGNGTCAGRRASATRIDEEETVFASIDSYGGHITCFYDELARRGVIGATWEPQFSEEDMSARTPYLWSYPMANDRIFASLGNWACSRLAGRFATHGGPDVQAKPRRFGVILNHDTRIYPMSIDPLRRELDRCGSGVAEFVEYGNNSEDGTQGADPRFAANAILAMKAKDVTTVFCLCIILIEQSLPPAATAQQYFPEWILSTFALNDSNVIVKAFWPEAAHRAHSFGLTMQPRLRRLQSEPGWWALSETDPGMQPAEAGSFSRIYRSLLLVASGIQMAGPTLTPQTFERALQRTSFPNPDTPAIGSGKVGFSGGSHAMTIDAAEMWWSESAVAPDFDHNSGASGSTSGTGAWCFVHGPTRHSPGTWPETDRLFTPPCDAGGSV